MLAPFGIVGRNRERDGPRAPRPDRQLPALIIEWSWELRSGRSQLLRPEGLGACASSDNISPEFSPATAEGAVPAM